MPPAPSPSPRASRRSDFALATKENGVSTALIVHPMSMFSPTTSPTYGADWRLAAFLFQRQEMQQLVAQAQTLENPPTHEPARVWSLLDCACEENLQAILGFLDGRSLCAVRRVSHQFYDLGANEQYWYNLCIVEWALSPDQLRERPESFQALYKFAGQSLQKLIRDYFQEQCLSSMQTALRIPREAALTIARRSFVSY